MGGRGASSSVAGGNIPLAIKYAKSGKLETTIEDINDLKNTKYGIDTSRLSASERTKLSKMVKDEKEIQNIKKGDVAHINVSDLSSKQLESLIGLTQKVSTLSAQMAMNDALKMLSWKNQK